MKDYTKFNVIYPIKVKYNQ